MHLGNGAITPGCAAWSGTLTLAGLGMAAASLRAAGVMPRKLMMAGALGAGIFAAQAVNVPLLPFASGHLVGGVLAAWVLGAPLGALTMAAVLVLQAVLLGDGGFLTLGANVLNMALFPALLVALAQKFAHSRLRSDTEHALLAGVTASLAVLGAAALIIGEVALFRGNMTGLAAFSWEMLTVHAWLGLAEGAVTAGLLALLGQLQPTGRMSSPRLWGTYATGLALVTLLLPLSSRMLDGYEASVERAGLTPMLESLTGINQTMAQWQQAVVGALPGQELVMMLTGMAMLGGSCWLLAQRVSPPALTTAAAIPSQDRPQMD